MGPIEFLRGHARNLGLSKEETQSSIDPLVERELMDRAEAGRRAQRLQENPEFKELFQWADEIYIGLLDELIGEDDEKKASILRGRIMSLRLILDRNEQLINIGADAEQKLKQLRGE